MLLCVFCREMSKPWNCGRNRGRVLKQNRKLNLHSNTKKKSKSVLCVCAANIVRQKSSRRLR